MPQFYPDIFEYLHDKTESTAIDITEIEVVVHRICAKTGLSPDIAKLIVKHYFLEVRKAILYGKIVYLSGIGKLYIANFASKHKTVFPKLDIYKSFSRKLNE